MQTFRQFNPFFVMWQLECFCLVIIQGDRCHIAGYILIFSQLSICVCVHGNGHISVCGDQRLTSMSCLGNYHPTFKIGSVSVVEHVQLTSWPLNPDIFRPLPFWSRDHKHMPPFLFFYVASRCQTQEFGLARQVH